MTSVDGVREDSCRRVMSLVAAVVVKAAIEIDLHTALGAFLLPIEDYLDGV